MTSCYFGLPCIGENVFRKCIQIYIISMGANDAYGTPLQIKKKRKLNSDLKNHTLYNVWQLINFFINMKLSINQFC